ncbi:MAG: DUF2089 family protein, partial [Trueperaceae bacterium]
RMLGVSYPTVRARFEQLLRALGYEAAAAEEPGPSRADVLGQLERGEITAEEATRALKALQRAN